MITDEMLCTAAGTSLEAYVSYLESDYDPNDQHVFSDEFEKKMRKLIRKAKHPGVYLAAKRIAVILLAALLSASVWLSVDTQARATFFGWVKGMYETFFVYRFSGEVGEPAEPGDYSLTWLPDGYSLDYEEDTGSRVTRFYINEAGEILKYHYIYGPDAKNVFVDAENAVIIATAVDKYSADVFVFDNSSEANVIMWSDGNNHVFVISAYLDESDLIMIANSIYKK